MTREWSALSPQGWAKRGERADQPFGRYAIYDFDVFSDHNRIEKLSYIHWNTVKRGLIEKPEDSQWMTKNSTEYYKKAKMLLIRRGNFSKMILPNRLHWKTSHQPN
jgi:hypothetical protein